MFGFAIAQHNTWSDTQNLHPTGLAMLVLACAMTFMVHRKHVFLPFIFIAMFVTTAQRAVVAGLDFPFMRILILVGWARILMLGEARGFKLMTLDRVMILWGTVFVFANVVREQLIVYSCGWIIDNLGVYFLFRVLIREREHVVYFMRWVAIMAIPVGIFFFIEKMTRYNLFSIFGGVREITWVREGKLRCQGPFRHPILAGCLFAGLFPMIAILLRGSLTSKPMKFIGWAGMVGAFTVIICCASSTPLMGWAAGVGAMFLINMHKMVPLIRYGSMVGLVLLHFVMKAPVWHLVARIDLTGGSTGEHRYRLIDATIRHFNDWWLMGVNDTSYWGERLYDVTGHFVLQCSHGGIASFVSFILTLVYSFRAVSVVFKKSKDPRDRWMVWMVGAGAFSNCVSFIGVSYFGKANTIFLLQMALLASIEGCIARGAAFEKRRLAAAAAAVAPARQAAAGQPVAHGMGVHQ